MVWRDLYCFDLSFCVRLQRKDLLQLLIDSKDGQTKDGLETGEIVADVVGFLFAGHETTSVALTFATYLLAKDPEVQEKLANEIHEYFDENPVCDVVCVCVFACALHMTYMHMCAYIMYVCVHSYARSTFFLTAMLNLFVECFYGSFLRTSQCTMLHMSWNILTWF